MFVLVVKIGTIDRSSPSIRKRTGVCLKSLFVRGMGIPGVRRDGRLRPRRSPGLLSLPSRLVPQIRLILQECQYRHPMIVPCGKNCRNQG
jgi:hypothetical protein